MNPGLFCRAKGKFCGLMASLAFLSLLITTAPFQAHASPAVTIENDDWEIVVTAFGYSDLLLDKREGFLGREFLSGEWAAAVCFTKDGTPVDPVWLEPDLIFPDWRSNSDFGTETNMTVLDPFNPFNPDGFLVLVSSITNDCLRIIIRHEMVDSTTGVRMGRAPQGTGGAGDSVLSTRYAFKQTYTIQNISGANLTGVKLFQLLHGLETDTAVHDNRAYGGAFADYRYDSTQYGQSFSFDTRSGEIVRHTDIITYHDAMMPAHFGTGYYGKAGVDDHATGKPSIGVHLDIEADMLNDLDFFSPPEGRWVAGAQRHDLGDLAPGASVSHSVLLTIQTSLQVEFAGANVVIRSYEITGENVMRITFEETIGGPVSFRVFKATDLVSFPDTGCPGPECPWEQVLVPFIFNPAEPALKWVEIPIDPAEPRAFYFIQPAIIATPPPSN